MSRVVKQEPNDPNKEGFSIIPNNNKSASILMIQPLENINKELSYRQRQNRPFKVIQNLPINKHDTSKDSINQPDYSLLKHPLSVKDSAILYNSLIVSRFNWINHMFKTYWTRREQVIRGLDLNKKDKMIRFCNPVLSCGVHTFKIKLFFLKDDEREKSFKIEMERRREERIRRKQEKQEELQRKREEKEREEKEKELKREKIRQEYLAKIEEEKKLKEQQLQEQEMKEKNSQEKQTINEDGVDGKNIKIGESSQQLLSQKINEQDQSKISSDNSPPSKLSKEVQLKEKNFQNNITENKIVDQKDNTVKNKMGKEIDNQIIKEPIETGIEKPIKQKESVQDDKQKMNRNADFSVLDNSCKSNINKELSAPTAKEKVDNINTLPKITTSNEDTTSTKSIVPLNNNTTITPISNSETTSPKPKARPKDGEKPKPDTKDIMSNPESAIMIQNLNVLAKQDPHLNALMKKVASGSASTEQILEFQKYILKAKNMGDVTGYMQKLKIKQQQQQQQLKEKDKSKNLNEVEKSKEEIEKEKERQKEKQKERQRKKKEKLEKTAKSASPVPNIQTLTPEEIKRREEDLLKRAMEMKLEQEKQRMEKIRIKEEREREKQRLKQEKLDKKNKEREEKERLKKLAKEQKEQEREKKRLEKLAEKEKARIEREEKIKERQQLKERERLENRIKLENAKKQNMENNNIIKKRNEDSKLKNIKKIRGHDNDDGDDDNDDDDDRMGKLNNNDDDEDDDLWNDKLSPLQERYSNGAALVFEFLENPSSRFIIPKDTIYELIENEDDNEDDSNMSNLTDDTSIRVKDEDESTTSRPKSPYVTLLASFLLIHNQGEIDGWERRQAEAKAKDEEKERKRLQAIKNEEEEASENTIAQNARKRRRKKSAWNTSSSKRATRLSKKAKEMELLRREEEDFHEEDVDLRNGEKTEDVRPIPIYSCVTAKLSKVPFRFANFILESGNSMEDRRKNMKEIMKIGNKVPVDQLWYQIDGIKDEILGETLRYNLNRLDYSECGGKKYRTMFYKKFGKGGKS